MNFYESFKKNLKESEDPELQKLRDELRYRNDDLGLGLSNEDISDVADKIKATGFFISNDIFADDEYETQQINDYLDDELRAYAGDVKGGWEEIDSKSVEDSDGFTTDYTMYKNSDGTYRFVFGDKDLYGPEDDYDWEEDNEEVAKQWFRDYKGFSGEDFNESEDGKPIYMYITDIDKELPKDAIVGMDNSLFAGDTKYPKSGKRIFHTKREFTPEEMKQYGLELFGAEAMRKNPRLWAEINYNVNHPDTVNESEESDFNQKRDFLYAMYDKIKADWESIDWHEEMYYEMDMDVKSLTLIIMVDWGDWKHDHAALDAIAERSTHPIARRTEVTEEDGSDTYSANHYYKYSESQFRTWLNGPMNESEESDARHTKIVEMSERLKAMATELANIAEMYDEQSGDTDDAFYGTEDEYALEMLDQHISDLFLNDPVLSKLDDGLMTDIINEIINHIVEGYAVDFKYLLLTLKKYDALKAWGLELNKGGE